MGVTAIKGGTEAGTPAGARGPAWRPARWGSGLGLVALLWLLPLPAVALTILPGQSLEVDFSMSGPVATADVVTFSLGATTSAVGFTGMTVSFYDGATLLASRNSTIGNPQDLTAFVSPGSLWTDNAVTADLSSVQDGSIAGRIVLTPSFDGSPGSALDAAFFPATGLFVGQATGSNSLILPSGGAPVVGAAAAVPEPSPLALLASAALLGSVATRRRPRARS